MNSITANRTAAALYGRGATSAPRIPLDNSPVAVLHPASPDTETARMDIINTLMFLTADLGPSINR